MAMKTLEEIATTLSVQPRALEIIWGIDATPTLKDIKDLLGKSGNSVVMAQLYDIGYRLCGSNLEEFLRLLNRMPETNGIRADYFDRWCTEHLLGDDLDVLCKLCWNAPAGSRSGTLILDLIRKQVMCADEHFMTVTQPGG